MITVVAGGCSFVFGTELKDSINIPGKYYHSNNTFFALLARDCVYDCVAWAGFANNSIARTVIERCESKPIDAVLVSWTFPGRYEFRFNYTTEQRTGFWLAVNPWTNEEINNIRKQMKSDNEQEFRFVAETKARAKKTGVTEFAEAFYKHVGSSEYWETYSSLKEIVYLQNYLKIKNIPYMFTCADNCIIENYTIKNADSVINSLYKQIDFNKWFLFPAGTEQFQTQTPRGFYQWAIENKYPVGSTHPLEEAHQAAAELMKEKFNDLVKKSVQ